MIRQRHRIDTSCWINTIQIYLSSDLPLENVAVCCIFFQETCLLLVHAEDLPTLLGVIEHRSYPDCSLPSPLQILKFPKRSRVSRGGLKQRNW